MKTNGFTLIELIVVIVILGILAATAAPKFINLEAEAKTATLEAIKGAMEGASALVHGKSLVKGNHKLGSGDSPTVNIGNGVTLDIVFGYPRGNKSDWQDKLLDIDLNTYKLTTTINGAVLVYFDGDNIPSSSLQPCLTSYKPPSASNGQPTIKVNPCT